MKLRPYQERGVEFLLDHKRAGLFWDMRTGKTPVTLTAAKETGAEKLLIVCPASLQYNWGKASNIWAPKLKPQIFSYNFFQKEENAKFIAKQKWDYTICDEAHMLKSWSAKQTQNFIRIVAPQTKRLVLATGTPSTKSAADYHTLLSMLEPGRHGKFKDWCEEYCNMREVGAGKWARLEIYGYKNTEKLNGLIKNCCSILSMEEAIPELPLKQFSDFYVEIDIPEIHDDEAAEAIDEGIDEDKPPPSIIPDLRQLGLDKAKAAIPWLEEYTEPMVIFSWFRDTTELLENNLSNVAGRITGKETPRQKNAAIENFNKNGGKILCNLAAGSMGIDLSKADIACFIELPFSPHLFNQACARIVNIEKPRPVEIVSVISDSVLDKNLLYKLKTKTTGQKKCLA